MTRHRWTDEDLQQVKDRKSAARDSRTPHPRQGITQPSKKPQYKSKLEFAWALRLEVMKREGEIDGWLYEPFTFKLAEGKRYRADFLAWKAISEDAPYNVTIAYECKGWHKNYRDSLTHLSWAAQRFPFFQWKKVVRNGKTGFEVYDVVV